MDSETASSSADEHQALGSASDTRGRHRIMAELKRAEQDAKFLEIEMKELEETDRASIVCQEFLHTIESKPDPLLPLTNGPVNPSWDRWFEGPHSPRGCRCQIL